MTYRFHRRKHCCWRHINVCYGNLIVYMPEMFVCRQQLYSIAFDYLYFHKILFVHHRNINLNGINRVWSIADDLNLVWELTFITTKRTIQPTSKFSYRGRQWNWDINLFQLFLCCPFVPMLVQMSEIGTHIGNLLRTSWS